MMASDNINLPVNLQDKDVQAIVGFWWTSTLLKKLARRFFTGLGSSEAFFNVLITLTSRGIEVVDELDKRYAETAALLMASFTEDERSEMIRLTHKLREAMAASGL